MPDFPPVYMHTPDGSLWLLDAVFVSEQWETYRGAAAFSLPAFRRIMHAETATPWADILVHARLIESSRELYDLLIPGGRQGLPKFRLDHPQAKLFSNPARIERMKAALGMGEGL